MIYLIKLISFIFSQDSIRVTCEFKNYDNLWGNTYTCIVKNTKISTDVRVSEFVGKHEADKTNADVTTLYMSGEDLSVLPSGIMEIFPNLTGLRVECTTLEKLDRKIFKKLKTLTHVSLDNNKIETIPQNAFCDLISLEWLSVGGNKIKLVDKEAFKSLIKLNYLSLHRNQLEVLDSDVLKYNTEMKQLFLSQNKLKTISSDLILPLKKLSMIQLHLNPCINDDLSRDATINDVITYLNLNSVKQTSVNSKK